MSEFEDAMDYQNWTITQLKNQRDELRDIVKRFATLVVRYADEYGEYSDSYDEISEARSIVETGK